MYRKNLPGQMKIDVPFNVALNSESKWVKMADILPWDEIEEQYVKNFTGKNEGQVAKSARLAFCAVYIYISESLTDEKVTRYIQENPHLQYFCGFAEYTPQPPFDPSLMTHFRKRITPRMVMELTEKVFTEEALKLMDAPPPETEEEEAETTDESTETAASRELKNRGTLILDATCFPQNIKYPTDIGL
jgi:hypothetical protein